ncbi:unnamed protein product [Meganyctiphanes norvegica]|uniref:C2H2-type domain-containing protein n=1 Tax=Meganyctiphanes norvegica TaxID=48144 RepID=A0AAV2QPT3_MEGNR
MAPINIEHSIVCDFCPKVFTQVSSKKRHEENKHINVGGNIFECRYCGKGLSSKGNLVRHVNDAHCNDNETEVQPVQGVDETLENSENIFCSFCDQKFSNSSNKFRHERVKHFTTGMVSLKCSYCNIRLRCKANKIKHEQDVHGVDNEKMEVQSDDTGSRVILSINDENVVMHNIDNGNELLGFENQNVDKIICSFCPQEFTQLKSKVRHERNSHIDTEKKFECTICSKRFNRKLPNKNMKIRFTVFLV